MSNSLKAQAIMNLDESTIPARNQEIVNQIVRNLTYKDKKEIIQNIQQNPQASQWIKGNVEKFVF